MRDLQKVPLNGWHLWGPAKAAPGSTYHIYPLNDLREHVLDGSPCWCGPGEVAYPNNCRGLVHNALDGRELVERYGAAMNGKNKRAGIARVSFEDAKARILAYMRQDAKQLYAPSQLACVVWPGHTMRSQGAAFAIGPTLHKLAKEGAIVWDVHYYNGIKATSWGWRLPWLEAAVATVKEPTPAPPFMVQCYRKGQHTTWFTDRTFHELLDATEHAEQVHVYWDRKVRVIDQNEHVWLRRP